MNGIFLIPESNDKTILYIFCRHLHFLGFLFHMMFHIQVLVSKAIGRQLLKNKELDETDGACVNLCGTVENIFFEVEEK